MTLHGDQTIVKAIGAFGISGSYNILHVTCLLDYIT